MPGVTTLPLILDGAKRDRAVWEGDLSVSGPALLYSSDATAYLKDSLELLGSYPLQSGFVEGVQTPSTPVTRRLSGRNGPSCSASWPGTPAS